MRERGLTTPQLVVALDVPAMEEARRLVALLLPAVRRFKIGLELFTAAGPESVNAVLKAGGSVLLDLKLHDIPNTVAGAVRSAAHLGVEMVTLHLAGGAAMVRAAVDAARAEGGTPLLLGVIRLTSEPAIADPEAVSPGAAWSRVVADAALAAVTLGLDGVVVSAHEVPWVREACPPGFLTLTPGIRPEGAGADDQARVATPAEAARAGSDLIVVGRPITRAGDPLRAALDILREMEPAGAPRA